MDLDSSAFEFDSDTDDASIEANDIERTQFVIRSREPAQSHRPPSLSPPSEDPESRNYQPPLPTEKEFVSPEAGISYINKFLQHHGYAVSTLRSKKDKKNIRKIAVYLCCDQGWRIRQRPGNLPRLRKTSTRSTECPFRAVLRLKEEGPYPWKLEITEAIHNHKGAGSSAHPAHRREVINNMRAEITGQLTQGIHPSQILSSLHQEAPYILAKDIYNARAKQVTEFLGGRSPIQAVLYELPQQGWLFRYSLREDDSLLCLFAMHESSLTFLKENPYILWMDCTFKTNRFKMPLLDIVGSSSTGTS
jgi:hypothetical protein